MERWEYSVLSITSAHWEQPLTVADELNEYGKTGWELVSLSDEVVRGFHRAVFKRRLPE